MNLNVNKNKEKEKRKYNIINKDDELESSCDAEYFESINFLPLDEFQDIEMQNTTKDKENNTDNIKKGNKISNNRNKLNYFDLICNEINDLYPKENTIPSKDFFDDNYLENVKNLLKSYGIYIVKLVSSNYKSFYECYLQLEKHFMSIFNIPSEGGLASIYFCFKEKIDIKEYQDKFIKNRDIVEKGNIIDHSVIKTFANAILVKLEDMTEKLTKRFEEENENGDMNSQLYCPLYFSIISNFFKGINKIDLNLTI